MIRPIVKYTNACLLLVIVFIIGDLYFAYNDKTCTNAAITNIKLSFGLGTWLKISALTNVILFILSISGLNLHKLESNGLILTHMTMTSGYIVFKFIWIAIGSAIFWGYLSKQKLCSKYLHTYMWVNLLCGIAILFALCFSQHQIYEGTYSIRKKFDVII